MHRARSSRTPVLVLWCFAACLSAACAPARASQQDPDLVELSRLAPRIRYAAGLPSLTFRAEAPVTLSTSKGKQQLAAGTWKLTLSEPQAARTRHYVYPKTFQPGESAALKAYLAEWKARGYAPVVQTFGKKLRTSRGRVIDNRIFWVAVARVDTEAEVSAMKKRIERDAGVWAWSRAETFASGTGTATFTDTSGRVAARLQLPFALESAAPIVATNVNTGFWRENRSDRTIPAPLTLEVGPDAKLEIYGRMPLEEYLKGVLPAEMSHTWPPEALRAQAVAARSEVLANLAGKHQLEGFDFCALEHCRAYAGYSGHAASTDAAVDATRGEALVSQGRLVPTVYSASCGGWSEDNDAVWSGPPNAALRAVGDFPARANPAPGGPAAYGMRKWLTSTPEAYCAIGANQFRWTKRYTSAELSALVNKHHKVGAIKSITEGERGAGGRLKSVTVAGAQGTVTIRKELPIRQAFGGLPSAMCIIDQERGAGGGTVYVIRGGGHGHGVGLCQQGARGMAARGLSHRDIALHYFSGTELERLD